MLKLHNAVVQIDPEFAEDVESIYEKLARVKGSAKPYSRRYKQQIQFHSAHKVEGDVLNCIISGPETEELQFQIEKDENGFLFRQRVGTFSSENLETMNRSLKGLLKKLNQPRPDGFSTKRLDGIYLWGTNPDGAALVHYDEAVALGQMSKEFRDTCVAWNISVKKFPEV